MKKLLPVVIFLACISCNNQEASPKPEDQKKAGTKTSEKVIVKYCVFFLGTVKRKDKITTYYTPYYILEKPGFIEMALIINRLRDCIKVEMARIYAKQGVTIADIAVEFFKFPTKIEAEEYYSRYVKSIKPTLYVSIDCSDIK